MESSQGDWFHWTEAVRSAAKELGYPELKKLEVVETSVKGPLMCFLCFQQGMGRVSASFVCLLCSINCWVEKNTAPL